MSAALAPACQVRAATVRAMAQDAPDVRGQVAYYPVDYDVQAITSSVASRLAWDAYAACEYARPVLSDALDVETLRPDLADDVWHDAAGATILGTVCCASPAEHRDRLVALAERLRTGVPTSSGPEPEPRL